MSRIIEIGVEAKKSANFQTYTASEKIHLDEDDDVEFERSAAKARCRKAVMAEIAIDRQK